MRLIAHEDLKELEHRIDSDDHLADISDIYLAYCYAQSVDSGIGPDTTWQECSRKMLAILREKLAA